MQSAPPPSSSLRSDRSNNSLSPGESLVSQNARYKVTYETNGDLVLYPGALWAAGAGNVTTPLAAMMSADGRLTLMNAKGRPYWVLGVAGAGVPPYRFAVQNDRTLAIYDHRNVWAAGVTSTRPGKAIIFEDGNFALTDSDNGTYWETMTRNVIRPPQPDQDKGHYRFTVMNDGNLVVSDLTDPTNLALSSGEVMWQSGTALRWAFRDESMKTQPEKDMVDDATAPGAAPATAADRYLMD
ncbi:hypothetical protein TSOC_012189 [Tetrabaena socialis]|uniref:Bulb-type lectin domain-containing protein n=1 Tax=Tetrabaena socialis TaxID=47790 RepID=A0A2J7ZNP6_9CHLO|nr:hypothetical protein TSOC_012189 [Tetrabaena socialis]|eukprot:PNH01885.1 hypothetical protein TSOC_012189 [Tetrabaena socialis]